MLQDAGFRVIVCDIADGGHEAFPLGGCIERRVLETVSNLYDRKHRAGALTRLVSRQMFRQRLWRTLSEVKPDLVISYDPPAFAAIADLFPERKRRSFFHIWHCHEAAIYSGNMGWGTRRDTQTTQRRSRDADMVIVPDQDRFDALFQDCQLKQPPLVVMNCPRRLELLPAPDRLQQLKDNYDAKIVLYLGSVGPGHGLETAVDSMCDWPSHAYFCVVGPCSESYRKEILERACRVGVVDRLVMAGPVAPEQALALRAGADVILTVMNTDQPIYRYCAGASNKRFEAMAVGRAQVTNRGPGINKLFVDPGVALAVTHDSVEETGSAISALLLDPEWREQMGARARQLHLLQYNYETEFAFAFDIIRGKFGL